MSSPGYTFRLHLPCLQSRRLQEFPSTIPVMVFPHSGFVHPNPICYGPPWVICWSELQ
jgi:hypothetical protein